MYPPRRVTDLLGTAITIIVFHVKVEPEPYISVKMFAHRVSEFVELLVQFIRKQYISAQLRILDLSSLVQLDVAHQGWTGYKILPDIDGIFGLAARLNIRYLAKAGY